MPDPRFGRTSRVVEVHDRPHAVVGLRHEPGLGPVERNRISATLVGHRDRRVAARIEPADDRRARRVRNRIERGNRRLHELRADVREVHDEPRIRRIDVRHEVILQPVLVEIRRYQLELLEVRQALADPREELECLGVRRKAEVSQAMPHEELVADDRFEIRNSVARRVAHPNRIQGDGAPVRVEKIARHGVAPCVRRDAVRILRRDVGQNLEAPRCDAHEIGQVVMVQVDETNRLRGPPVGRNHAAPESNAVARAQAQLRRVARAVVAKAHHAENVVRGVQLREQTRRHPRSVVFRRRTARVPKAPDTVFRRAGGRGRRAEGLHVVVERVVGGSAPFGENERAVAASDLDVFVAVQVGVGDRRPLWLDDGLGHAELLEELRKLWHLRELCLFEPLSLDVVCVRHARRCLARNKGLVDARQVESRANRLLEVRQSIVPTFVEGSRVHIFRAHDYRLYAPVHGEGNSRAIVDEPRASQIVAVLAEDRLVVDVDPILCVSLGAAVAHAPEK